MKRKILVLRDDEIAVSCKGLASRYTGNSDKLTKQLKNVIDKDLQDDGQNQVWVTIGEERFFFGKRQTGSRIVWALPLSDKTRLAKAMGWREKIELGRLQDNEIPVSVFGLAPHFIGDPQNLRDRLREVLSADRERTTLLQLRCTIGEETFTFIQRQNGTHVVWALPLSDKERLAKAMGWEERVELEQLQDNEIPVSGPGLSPHFIGNSNNLGKQLREILTADSENTNLLQLQCTIGEETFIFSKRQTGSRIVWALPLSDKARFAKAMGWTEKVELGRLRDNEIPVSVLGLSPHFIGDRSTLSNQLKEVLTADPEKAELPQLTCIIGEEAFTFTRRLTGPGVVWAFPFPDKARLAKAMGWREKIELGRLQDNEISVSIFGLTPHFIGDPQNLRDRLREVLTADPERTTFLQLRCTIDEETFTFSQRQNGTHVVWALPLSDKVRLAKAMNWEIRKKEERSTGVADLATFLSVLGKNVAATSRQNDGSSTEK